MACLLAWYARRIAHPCDGSRSVNTLPPDQCMPNETLFDHQHRAVGTRDEGTTEFLIIFTHRTMSLMITLNIYFGSLSMQSWAFLSYTRYYYGALGSDTTGLVHLSFIFGGLVMALLIALYFVWANYRFDDSGGNSVPRYIATQKRVKAIENRERRKRQAEAVGDTSYTDLNPADQTMEEVRMDHLSGAGAPAATVGDVSGLFPVTGADGIPVPDESNQPRSRGGGGGIAKLIQVVHPCRGVDFFEDCPRLERSRTFRLITKVVAALWFFEFVVTILDFSIFLEITDPSSEGYKETGGVNALFGISILVGVALSLFPPWYFYQKKMVKCVAHYLH